MANVKLAFCGFLNLSCTNCALHFIFPVCDMSPFHVLLDSIIGGREMKRLWWVQDIQASNTDEHEVVQELKRNVMRVGFLLQLQSIVGLLCVCVCVLGLIPFVSNGST